MSESRHSLLLRQLKRVFGDGPTPVELGPFVDAVDEAYRAFDADRAMLERSLELSSQELLQANAELRRRQAELTAAQAALEERVAERTRQLEAANAELRRQMSERAAAEAQLRQSQRMEAIGRLAGGIAHDFNNLLTAVLGYTHLLIGALGTHPAVGHAEEIRRATLRASSLTRQLLAFSRRQRLSPVDLDLNHALADIGRLLRRLIGEHIDIDLQLAPEGAVTRVDPTQFEQVVINLAINSRDAMPEGGRLTFRTTRVDLDEGAARQVGLRAGAYVGLDVEDTGTGIDPETLPHIFEPFFTTKPPGEGTGLGLSTVYGIVKQSGGGVAVARTAPGGTTIRVYLPRAIGLGAATAEPAAAARPAPGPVAARRRVLVVEDEDAVRRLIGAVLGAEGYRAILAANGREALTLLESPDVEVDLVVTDIVMPVMNGRDLAARLKDLRPNLPLLFMTGYEPGVDAGTPESDILLKPFTPDSLLIAVRDRLERTLRAS
ncbi:MAG: ATP-binding protein [Acidobacteriota bacterium]